MSALPITEPVAKFLRQSKFSIGAISLEGMKSSAEMGNKMADFIEDNEIPVFLINGFLESGKTKFLNFTFEQEYFQSKGKTLLILCEEGDTEYDDRLLQETNTVIVTMEDRADMNPKRLSDLELLHDPERVVIEWNGMWDQDTMKLPEDWVIYQQITIIDGSTFELYSNNMKPLLAAMVRNSELIICNRCDGLEDKISVYRRTLMALNQKAQIIFENAQGEMDLELTEEDLPYDMKADVIEIAPQDYGIWYIDCMDHPQRYEGRVIEFTAMVLKSPKFPKNYFVPGRMAITCCADDMTFLGYICKAKEARKLETRQWVHVRAKVVHEFWQDYNGEGPVLYADFVEPAEPLQEAVQF